MDERHRVSRPGGRRGLLVVLALALWGTGSCEDATTPEAESPTLTTTVLAEGRVSVLYSERLTATGGQTPYTWDITAGSLPDNLALVPSTGVINGVPSRTGTSEFTARVTGGDGLSATRALSLTIASSPLQILFVVLDDAVLDIDYETQLQAIGGTGEYLWSIVSGGLPDGLSLSGDVVSGRPTKSGYFPLRIQVESDGSTAAAGHRIRVYPTLDLRIFLSSLPSWIASSLEYNQDLLPQSPQLASELEAKIEMLSDPGLESSILNEGLFEAEKVMTLDGRAIPATIVFPSDTMRWGAKLDLERIPPTISTLEEFLDVPWPVNSVREWYGFRIGHTGGGGALYMEDRGTYAERGVPNDVLIPHELGHTFIGHEGLNQFLEVYGYNVVETGSTDLSTWSWKRSVGGVPYVPFAPENEGAWAVMDVYQLIGTVATGRAFAKVHDIGAPYGVPLSAAARQAFVDEAPEDKRDQVADLVLRI